MVSLHNISHSAYYFIMIITAKDIVALYRCSLRHAQNKLRIVRIALGKKPNIDGKKGADPVTFEEFYKHFNITK